jgi:hypothetical protein
VVEGMSRIIQEQVKEKNIEGVLVARGLIITHLMFLDDVILFMNGKITEWTTYKEVLDLFYKATRMTFSLQKSLFLESCWLDEEIVSLKEIMPFEVKPLDVGFKYLGFFLKPNCYTRDDWKCLERKFEKMISNWSHR